MLATSDVYSIGLITITSLMEPGSLRIMGRETLHYRMGAVSFKANEYIH